MENEKYPRIELRTDNIFTVLIDENTPVCFRTLDAFKKFIKENEPRIELKAAIPEN